MNHLKQIAARLPEYGLDAMLLNSEPGEYYAVGFHGEGNVVVTAQGCFYFTDSRYIEAANHLITGAEIAMTGRSRNYRAMVQEVVDRCRIRKLGFEEAICRWRTITSGRRASPPSWCPPRSWWRPTPTK